MAILFRVLYLYGFLFLYLLHLLFIRLGFFRRAMAACRMVGGYHLCHHLTDQTVFACVSRIHQSMQLGQERICVKGNRAAYVDQTAQFQALDYNDELARDILPTKFIANEASEKGDVIFIDTPDGGMEEGEEWVEPTEAGKNDNAGFDVTHIVLALSVIFVAAAIVLNFRKPK